MKNLKGLGSWNINFVMNFIHNSRFRVSIIHKRRDSNVMVSDTLAKQGLKREDDFFA